MLWSDESEILSCSEDLHSWNGQARRHGKKTNELRGVRYTCQKRASWSVKKIELMLAPLPSLTKGVPPPRRGYIGLSCAASFSSLTLCPSSACRHRTLAVDNFAKRSPSRSRWASGSVHECLPQMVSAPSSAKQKQFFACHRHLPRSAVAVWLRPARTDFPCTSCVSGESRHRAFAEVRALLASSWRLRHVQGSRWDECTIRRFFFLNKKIQKFKKIKKVENSKIQKNWKVMKIKRKWQISKNEKIQKKEKTNKKNK